MTQTESIIVLVHGTSAFDKALRDDFVSAGMRVVDANGPDELRAMLAELQPDAVVVKAGPAEYGGIDLIRELRRTRFSAVIMAVTSETSLGETIDAICAGADEVVAASAGSARIVSCMQFALRRPRAAVLGGNGERGLSPVGNSGQFERFIGDHPLMRDVYRTIDRAAGSRATVLITGESGTGKELCAEAIHRRGPRSAAPFVPIDCTAVPGDLIDSTLFGHVRGAYTGAGYERTGAVLKAQGGTLFLDEIGNLDLKLQAKLLRLLETRTVQPVGSGRSVHVDVRFVCATNRDPLDAIADGTLREDLYYHLDVVRIDLPPLRERGDDVLLIARQLLLEISREEGRGFADFEPRAATILREQDWPGNVRELQNLVRRIVVINDGPTVTPEMLQLERARAVRGWGTRRRLIDKAGQTTLEAAERLAIEDALAICGGKKAAAASLLGIDVSTLYRKRKAWLAATA